MGSVRSIEVVVEEGQIIRCRPYKWDKGTGIEVCFGDDNKLKRIRYSPDKFEEVTGADLSRINERLKDCPLCREGDIEAILGQGGGTEDRNIYPYKSPSLPLPPDTYILQNRGEGRGKVKNLTGKEVAGILGAQVGAVVATAALAQVDAHFNAASKPVMEKPSTWGAFLLGIGSLVYGAAYAPTTWAIPMAVLGGQLVVNTATALVQSYMAPPAAPTAYRIVASAPSVAQVPAFGGKVEDYTGGV
jgi:hypothetical protein